MTEKMVNLLESGGEPAQPGPPPATWSLLGLLIWLVMIAGIVLGVLAFILLFVFCSQLKDELTNAKHHIEQLYAVLNQTNYALAQQTPVINQLAVQVNYHQTAIVQVQLFCNQTKTTLVPP